MPRRFGSGGVGTLTPGQQIPTHPKPRVSVKPSFWKKELDWRRIWAARYYIVGVLALMYIAGFAVNRGPSMNGLGWVYLQMWGAQPTRDGQIFVFVPADKPAWMKFVPGQQWVKRRVGVTPDGRYIFEGDNENWSADNRDKLEPVPPDHVAGVVYSAISPRRIANCLTARGRFDNWLTWNYPPGEIFRDGAYVAVDHGGVVRVWGSRYSEISGYSVVGWQGGRVRLTRNISKYVDEFAMYDAADQQLIKGVNSQGERLLPLDVHRRFSWGGVEGPLVYAVDDDPATNWEISSAVPQVTEGAISFTGGRRSGVLNLCGGGDAAVTMDVLADGRLLQSVGGQWRQLKVPFTANKVTVRFTRHEPSSSSGLAKVTVEGLSSS